MSVPSPDSRKDSNVMHIRGPATATARLVSQMGQEQCSTIFTLMYIDHNNRISILASNKIHKHRMFVTECLSSKIVIDGQNLNKPDQIQIFKELVVIL